MNIEYLAGVFDVNGIVRFQVLDSGKVVKKELYLRNDKEELLNLFQRTFGGQVNRNKLFWVLRDEYRMRKALKELKKKSFLKRESFALMQKALNTVKNNSKKGKPLSTREVDKRIKLAEDIAWKESTYFNSKRVREKYQKMKSTP